MAGPSVLLVAHGFVPHNFAGVEIYTHALAAALAQRCRRVAVLYPVADPAVRAPAVRRAAVDGLEVFELAAPPGDALGTLVHSEKEAAFGALLAAEGFEVVHFQHTFHGLPMSLLRVAKRAGAGVALTLHDFWFLCPRTHLYLAEEHRLCAGPAPDGRCERCIAGGRWDALPEAERDACRRFVALRHEHARELLDEVDVVSAPSRFVAETFARHGLGGGRIEVHPLGVRPLAALPRRQGHPLTFGYLGTIQPLKNVLALVEAFSALRGDVRLELHGHGPEQAVEELRRRATDPRIAYRGPYAPGDLPSLLAGMDAVVVPSIVESYCFTVREALGAGVPVIASRVGGIPDAVVDGVNGLLFDPRDPAELRRKLEAFRDAPAQLDARAGPAIPTIEEDASAWAARYAQLARAARRAPLGAPPGKPTEPVMSQRREAFLLEPDWERGEWESVLLGFIRAFAPDEPVALILPLDPGTPVQPSLERAAERVMAVVERAGKERFAEVLLLEQPAEFLEKLRAFDRTQWVAAGLDGVLGARLAEAWRAAAAQWARGAR